MLPDIGPAEPPSALPNDTRENTAYLHKGLDLVFEYVEKTNFAALGLLGVLGLLAIVDTVMGFAIDMLQTGKRLTHVKNLVPQQNLWVALGVGRSPSP